VLVVRIELWPGGNEQQKRDLGTAFIVNDMAGTRQLGRYNVMLSKWGRPDTPWRVGRVDGFDRLRGSPWDLLRKAITAATGSRNADHALRTKMVRTARHALRGQAALIMEEDGDQEDQYGVVAEAD
jgi:hypothetical protein